MPKKKTDYAPHIPQDQAPGCSVAGCRERGAYKAPMSKDRLHDYQWLCLDHIREYNKQWDFFSGMDRNQIEHFMRDAVTGHRPTWSRESHLSSPHEKLEDALHQFLHGKPRKPAKAAPAISPKMRQALALLGIEHPYNLRGLKSQYRQLVKKYHPDAHKGSKRYEEKFKEITAAYLYLSQQLKNAGEPL